MGDLKTLLCFHMYLQDLSYCYGSYGIANVLLAVKSLNVLDLYCVFCVLILYLLLLILIVSNEDADVYHLPWILVECSFD